MAIENRMMVEGLREDAERQRVWDIPYFEEDCTTYCEIYGCSECPRYGDDCDGEDFEDLNDREFDIPYEEV